MVGQSIMIRFLTPQNEMFTKATELGCNYITVSKDGPIFSKTEAHCEMLKSTK